MVQTLAASDICKAVDGDGKEIEVKVSPSMLTYPRDCKMLVKPRSRRHVKLIGQLENRSSEGSSDAGLLEDLNE